MMSLNKKAVIVLAIIFVILIWLIIFIIKNFYPLLLLSLVIFLWILHYMSLPQQNEE